MIDETETTPQPMLPSPDFVQPITEGVRQIFGAGLRHSATAADLDELMDQVYAFAEGVHEDLKQRFQVDRSIACGEGCHFCCHNHEVHLSPPEALRIASYITSGESRIDLAHAREKAQAVTERKDIDERESGSKDHRKLFRCPLLDAETGNCGVYPVRPLVCRGQNSVDSKVCERRLEAGTEEGEKIVGWFHQRAGAQAILNGVRLAMIDAGHEDQVLDLTRSLAVLLSGEETIALALTDDEVLEPARARTVR